MGKEDEDVYVNSRLKDSQLYNVSNRSIDVDCSTSRVQFRLIFNMP